MPWRFTSVQERQRGPGSSVGIQFDRAKVAAEILAKPPPSLPEGLQEGTPEAEAATKSYNDQATANTKEALTKLKVNLCADMLGNMIGNYSYFQPQCISASP